MRRAVFAAFALVLTLTIVGATALAGAAPHDSGVSATDGSGRRLGENPRLHAGDRVVVTASGFAPNATVAIRTDGSGAEVAVRADAQGVARTALAVTARLAPGAHALTFVGSPVQHGSAASGNVEVLVPQVARFAFRVVVEDAGEAGVAGVSTGRDSGTPLAHTGVDVASGLAVAAFAVGIGFGVERMARAGRRRRFSARRADGTGY